MNTSNWRPIEGGSGDVGDSSMESSDWRAKLVTSMESSDWRAKLQADSRERMVNKILDAMKMHIQVSGDEGLQEFRKTAERFEEKVYIAATSQSEYMRKICFKILTIETRSQNPMPDANSVNPSDPASLDSTNDEYWKEQVYEKIKAMKDLYLPDLNYIHQKLLLKLQQHDSLPQQPNNEQHEKLQSFKDILERFMLFLQIPKHKILATHKDKLSIYGKQIVHVITLNRRKPAATQPPPPPPQPLPPPTPAQNISVEVNINPLVSHDGMSTLIYANGEDWQEEVYQKIKVMKDMYLLDLNNIHQNILLKIQQQPKNEQLEKLKVFKNMLEHFMAFLQIPKHHILANYKDNLSSYEKQIVHVTQQQEEQLHPPHMQSHSQLTYENPMTSQMPTLNLQQNPLSASNLDSVSGSGAQQVNMLHTKQQEQLLQSQLKQFQNHQMHKQQQQFRQKQGNRVNQMTQLHDNGGDMFNKPLQSANTTNVWNIVHGQESGAGLTSQSLAIGTPGISASPLFSELTSPDGNGAVEQPLERLLKVVKSISSNTLSAPVSDIGEDLVAMTKSHLEERSFVTQDETNPIRKKMKRCTSVMPSNAVSSAGSVKDSFKQLTCVKTSELDSTASSANKRPRIEQGV